MIPRIYKVTLTNGTTQQEYKITAIGRKRSDYTCTSRSNTKC